MIDTQPAPPTVFVSHKIDKENSQLAKEIASLLGKAFINKGINFFLSENIPKGDDWHSVIRKRLSDTDYLLFLYTNPNSDWSWCVYETTIFMDHMRGRNKSQRMMYCFHFDGQEPPNPFQTFQTIAVNQNDITEWLNQLCSMMNCQLKANDINDIATRMTKLFEQCRPRTLSTRYLQPSISIRPRWSEDVTQAPNWSAIDLPDFPVGRDIVMEARLQEIDFDGGPFELFDDKQQIQYKSIHAEFLDAYEKLQRFSQQEDVDGGKSYNNSESVLKDLRRTITEYFLIAIPRFSDLLSQRGG